MSMPLSMIRYQRVEQKHSPAHVRRLQQTNCWNGHDITDSGVFHQYKLQLNWLTLKDAIKDKLTVLDNVLWKQGNLMPAIELMGLGKLAQEKLRMLSMGQRKRLQLARLLAIDRPIWLLDEPSSTLYTNTERKGGLSLSPHIFLLQRKTPRFPRRMTLVDMLDRGGPH